MSPSADGYRGAAGLGRPDLHRDSLLGTGLRTELAMNALERVLLLVTEASGADAGPLIPGFNR